jgi:hypothetical protein
MCWLTLVIEVWWFHAYRQWSLALIREGVGVQCLYWLAVRIKARNPSQPPKTRLKTPPVPVRSAPKRAVNGRASPSLVTSAALAATLVQSGLKPRDPAAFERAAMLAQKHPGLTQEEIAEQADVPRQTLGRWMERVPEAFRAAA